MRIHFMSDIHLEFGPLDIPSPPAADVVVLAGDIGVGVKGVEWARATFPSTPVIVVAGNHELYHGAHPKTIEDMKAAWAGSNVHVLEQETLEIDGVRFLGATLWTDFALFGEDKIEGAMSLAHSRMNDYRQIRQSPSWSKIRPGYTRALHLQTRMWLRKELGTPFAGNTVVITHHSPSLLSLHPRYHADPLSAAFASRMDDRIDGSHPHAFTYPPELWIHGHTHHCVDYTIGRTRVVSNQRGYEPAGEVVEGWDVGKVVEI